MNNTAGSTPDESSARDARAAFSALRRIRQPRFWQVFGPPMVFATMLFAVSILNPSYLTGFGISIVTASAAPIMLVALGQSMVLNIGSIDLSNAAISLLGAILLALSLPSMGIAAPIVILALVTLFGAINGVIVAYAQVPSFALTLGTLGIFEAAALVISGANTVYVSQNRELVTVLYQYRLADISLTFWIGVLAAVLYWMLLQFTTIGQSMTAIGKSEAAAIFSAIRTRLMKILAFAISGFTAGLAGVSIVAQAGSASASGLGSDLLLPGIAAALIGGTSISGGQTNPLNVVFGALTVAFVPIAIQALGISAQAQSLVYGFFIIIVVALTTTRSHDAIIK